MPVEHFADKEAYRKFNAYRHIHGIPAPNMKAVVVGGVYHKVKHSALSDAIGKRKKHGSNR